MAAEVTAGGRTPPHRSSAGTCGYASRLITCISLRNLYTLTDDGQRIALMYIKIYNWPGRRTGAVGRDPAERLPTGLGCD